LVTPEVSLAEPNVVDYRSDTTLRSLSELNFHANITSGWIDRKAIRFDENRDVVRAGSREAVAIDVGESSSEALVPSKEVREEHIFVENFNHFVAIARSVRLGEGKYGTLNSTTIAAEDWAVVDHASWKLVSPCLNFRDNNANECNQCEKDELVHCVVLLLGLREQLLRKCNL
jgi:hypothetical protein